MISVSIKDIIDILLVTFMLYYAYRFMKDSGSLKVFVGILTFILICCWCRRYWR